MRCPICNLKLEQTILAGAEVNYCSRCYGLWFEEDELQWAKDEKDRNLRWLDIDLWQDMAQFRISPAKKMCPADLLPLYEIGYGDSSVKVDVCNICHGIWLDRGELKNIIDYLKEKAQHQVLYHYLKSLAEEAWEVFSGPEELREELLDLLAILKLFRYKFAVQHPAIVKLITFLPK